MVSFQDWVKEQKKAGRSKEEIQAALLEKGHSSNSIESVDKIYSQKQVRTSVIIAVIIVIVSIAVGAFVQMQSDGDADKLPTTDDKLAGNADTTVDNAVKVSEVGIPVPTEEADVQNEKETYGIPAGYFDGSIVASSRSVIIESLAFDTLTVNDSSTGETLNLSYSPDITILKNGVPANNISLQKGREIDIVTDEENNILFIVADKPFEI